ncbi:tyrosine-type recombinase/integrase [Mycetohabitans endofungorum]|nr:tyrosine-type recombinase/integrase [Mycetohabitans endofungorum]
MSLWDEVKRFVEQLPQETAAQQAFSARCRWLITLFYLQGLRLSEVAHGTMGDFSRRLGPDGQDQWWLDIVGKGQRARRVPASPELIVELARYRQACGLPSLPRRAERAGPPLPIGPTNWCVCRQHWLRHTAGSHQANAGLDLRTVRDNLGHVSLTTTNVYLHEEEDTRHRQTVRGHRMNWSDQDPVEPPARQLQR